MASIFEYMKFRYLNIDAKVGIDGVNIPNDVYLVQALLFEVLTNRFSESRVNPPFPTGTFNSATSEAMAEYKRLKNEIAKKYPVGNPKVYFENHIDPIQGSIFAFGTNVPWAMVKLQSDILDMLVIKNLIDSYNSPIEYLFEKHPRLKTICTLKK